MADLQNVGVRLQLDREALKRIAELVPSRIPKRLLTVAEAAVYLGRSENAVRQMVRSHKIDVVRLDGRVAFDRHDLDKLIEASKER